VHVKREIKLGLKHGKRLAWGGSQDALFTSIATAILLELSITVVITVNYKIPVLSIS
jgi:hypothetical protein